MSTWHIYHHIYTNRVSCALYARQSSDSVDPLVQLTNQPAASHLYRGLKVHDLVGDVELMVDDLCVVDRKHKS